MRLLARGGLGRGRSADGGAPGSHARGRCRVDATAAFWNSQARSRDSLARRENVFLKKCQKRRGVSALGRAGALGAAQRVAPAPPPDRIWNSGNRMF